jgi:hypothetical protein
MKQAVAIFLWAASAATACASPVESMASALADARTLTAEQARNSRWLSLYAIPGDRREDFKKTLAFHVNAISREANLTLPTVVRSELVRIDLRDYGWTFKTWEKLAAVDPYFHVQTSVEETETVAEPTGQRVSYDGGRTWQEETRSAKKTRTRSVAAAAPWINAKQCKELAALTGSDCAVVRADWFFVQTGEQRQSPGYLDFLGLGERQSDFQSLLSVDVAASRKAKREIAAVLPRSGVSVNNRRLVRFQGLNGPYYVTDDYLSSRGKRNVLKFLDGDGEPPDESEQLGSLPNGLFAFWVQDGSGHRQSFVADGIGSDGNTDSADKRIYVGKSCIVCHVEGVRPLADAARKIFAGELKLQASEREKFKRLTQLYLSDLDGTIKADQEAYAAVLKGLNGLTPSENAKSYDRVWNSYAEADLTLADAARELGVDSKALGDALKNHLETEGQADAVLASLLQSPPVSLRREQFEEIFPALQAILKGHAP